MNRLVSSASRPCTRCAQRPLVSAAMRHPVIVSSSVSSRSLSTLQSETNVYTPRSSTYTNNTRYSWMQTRGYADKVIKTPPMAESISEGTLSQWMKQVGEFVARDEPIVVIETDKVDVTVNSPESGVILEQYAKEGDTIEVGSDLYKIALGDAPPAGAKPAEKKADAAPKSTPPPPPPAAAKKTTPPPPPPSSKLTPPPPPPSAKPAAAPSTPAAAAVSSTGPARTERRVKMNRMRMRIAERLKDSQNTAASLTTFNEIDMSNLMEMRSKFKDAVLKEHNVKLGFMSAFIKASASALQAVPEVNGRIEGDEVVYSDFVDISVAVATPKGLVTPVLRNCESMDFVQIEKAMSEMSTKARDNKITIEDLSGGTFTISNGGVFGSLMGTPIINQPQSAILGMHAIKERPVVVNGKIEIRPMMYVALTYDHRLIDGREAVTFLVKVKEAIEDPRRLLLNV